MYLRASIHMATMESALAILSRTGDGRVGLCENEIKQCPNPRKGDCEERYLPCGSLDDGRYAFVVHGRLLLCLSKVPNDPSVDGYQQIIDRHSEIGIQAFFRSTEKCRWRA